MRTGRIGFRRNWRGQIIVQVEFTHPDQHGLGRVVSWSDATEYDMKRLGLGIVNVTTTATMNTNGEVS